MEDEMKGLDPEQYEAAKLTEGFVRVVAGAGTGKTRALSHRFAYLVNEIGITPASILCVTFTNKAANEMKQRIRRLIGDNDLGFVCTFHSFCAAVLKEEANVLHFPHSFVVLDAEDENDILKLIYSERGLTSQDMTFRAARDMIEIVKGVEIPDYHQKLIDLSPEELKKLYVNAVSVKDIIFWGYVYYQKRTFGLDYSDLIYLTLYIYSEFPAIREKWQKRLEYIMIDEFQDIDEPQYRLMSVLCGYHHNLFIVGDPDQTVYTWRGANVKYINEFDQNFPGCKTIYLTRNYRSTPEIISAANSLISKNKMRIEKNLSATLPSGQTVIYNHLKTTTLEARWIAQQVEALISSGVKEEEIAVLYRAHYVSRAIEEEFISSRISYLLFSGTPFYCRKEIKDAIAYLRMTVSRDDLSFLRTVNEPKRNIGQRRIAFLKEYAEKTGCTLYNAMKLTADDPIWNGTSADEYIMLIENEASLLNSLSVPELLSEMLTKSGYEQMLRLGGEQTRLDNLAELKQSVEEYINTCGEDVSVDEYLTGVALFTSSDSDSKSDAVRMMTVHAAKGLEFPYVFLCGMNEGIFPSKQTDTIEKLEEERRLGYVALTRAEKGLFITDSEGFNHDGSFRYPSRFVLNIDRIYLEYLTELDEKLISDAEQSAQNQEHKLTLLSEKPLFKKGDYIIHKVFGKGLILDIDMINMCYLISFDSLSTARSISIRACLEKQ